MKIDQHSGGLRFYRIVFLTIGLIAFPFLVFALLSRQLTSGLEATIGYALYAGIIANNMVFALLFLHRKVGYTLGIGLLVSLMLCALLYIGLNFILGLVSVYWFLVAGSVLCWEIIPAYHKKNYP